MRIVPLDEESRPLLQPLADMDAVLPSQHPVWAEVLCAAGVDCRGLVAVRGGRAVGWLLYGVHSTPLAMVVNSAPLVVYGGVAAAPEAEVRIGLLRALRAEAGRLGADVLTVALSPFATREMEEECRLSIGSTHEMENFVQTHELATHPLEGLSPKRRDAFRSEVNRAKQAGLRVVHQLTLREFEEWLAVYGRLYAELGAMPYPEAFHRAAFERGVPTGAAEFWGVLDADKVVGGVMFLTSGRAIDYFSSAFRSEYRPLSPTTYLLNEAFGHFIARGVQHFNWQSSPGRGGVYRYKSRWGAREGHHLYLSAVLRSDSPLLKAAPAVIQRCFPLWFVVPFSALSGEGDAAQ